MFARLTEGGKAIWAMAVYTYIRMETTHFKKWLLLAEGTCNNRSPCRPFPPSRGETASQPPLCPPCERCNDWQRMAMIGTLCFAGLHKLLHPGNMEMEGEKTNDKS